MDTREIFEKVRAIVADQFGVDEGEITEATAFKEDLSADSLDLMEITMSLENDFDLGEVEGDTLESIRTVGDVVALLASKL